MYFLLLKILFYFNVYCYDYYFMYLAIFHLQPVLLHTEPSLQTLKFLKLKIYSNFALSKPTSCMLAFSKRKRFCFLFCFVALGIKFYFCNTGYRAFTLLHSLFCFFSTVGSAIHLLCISSHFCSERD